jgi:hypothetical protein
MDGGDEDRACLVRAWTPAAARATGSLKRSSCFESMSTIGQLAALMAVANTS